MLGRLRAVPAPLLAICCAAVVLAVAWAVVLPVFEGPDEISHFAYTQRVVERHSITWNTITHIEGAKPPGLNEPYSTEVDTADHGAGTSALAGNVAMKPYGTKADERLWQAAQRRTGGARDDGDFTSAMVNPPLYYLTSAPVYVATSWMDVFGRELVLRLWNLPFLIAAVAFTWLLIGEIFGTRRRWLQATGAGVVAVTPQVDHLAGVVNPDVMLAAIWAAALYLAVVTLRRGLTWPRALGLVGLGGASALTHGRGVALLVPVAATLGIAAWKRTAPHTRRHTQLAAAVVAGATAVWLGGVAWAATHGHANQGNVRRFAVYLWQFYLPKLSFMQASPRSDWGVRDVFIDRFFSGFGQFELSLPTGTLDALSTASRIGLLLLVVVLALSWRQIRANAAIFTVLVLAAVAMILGLHVGAWRSIGFGGGDPVITGRYLIPLMPLMALAIVTLIHRLPRAVAPGVGAALLGVGLMIDLSLLGIALTRFYV